MTSTDPPHHGSEHWRGPLTELTDEQLIAQFNREVGIKAWGSARSAFLTALRDELCSRTLDVSVVLKTGGLVLSHQAKLVGGKLELLEDSDRRSTEEDAEM